MNEIGLGLVDSLDLILNRVFDRVDVLLVRVHAIDQRIKRSRLTATRWTSD